MYGVKFGNYHSYEDFNLILVSKTIGAAKPKRASVDIPAGDGEIDYTDYFGDVNYENRSLAFEFNTIGSIENFLPLFSTIQNTIHGQRLKIVLDEDPEFYYLGRINVNEWKSDKRINKLTIEVDADPYKYRALKTTIAQTITTTQSTITCMNLRKRVVPTIKATVAANVTFNTYDENGTLIETYTKSIAANQEVTDSNIQFKPGQNTLLVTGTASGTITIEYQEGGL